MRKYKSGFLLVEAFFGLVILTLVIAGGAAMLKPLAQVNAKRRLTLSAQRLEWELRRSIYYQTNSSGIADFKIISNGVTLAQNGKVRYVREDLGESSETAAPHLPLRTELNLIYESSSNKHLLSYNISSTSPSTRIAALGKRDLSTTSTPLPPLSSASHNISVIEIPASLINSTNHVCDNGFLRGLRSSSPGVFEGVCWSFAPASTNNWALPTTFSMLAATNKIELEYSELNSLKCPSVLRLKDGTNKIVPGLYALKRIRAVDYFPKKTPGSTLTSDCGLTIDFTKGGAFTNGIIPAHVVAQNDGKCPDGALYKKNANGTCEPIFQLPVAEIKAVADTAHNKLQIIDSPKRGRMSR